MMKTEFIFKAIYLNRLLWRVVVIGTILSLFIFIGLDIDISFRYFLSMLIVFTGLLIVFYRNRHDLHKLSIEEDTVELIYFNKVFFKKTPSSHTLASLNTKLNTDAIEFSENSKIIGLARKGAIDPAEWEELISRLNLTDNP